MSEDTQTPTPQPTTPEPTLADVAKQVTEIRQAFDQRLDGLSKKNLERFEMLEQRLQPAPTSKPQGGDRKEPAPVDPDALRADLRQDILAEVRIDQARERMEDGQRERLDSILKSHGVRAAADMLDLLAPVAETGDSGANPVRGRAAMPRPSAAVSTPKTMSELKALKSKDPAAYQQLLDDPAFDFNLLRNV